MSADGTEYDLLTQVQGRLREKVPFPESCCFISDAPVPEFWPTVDPICTISVGDTQFDAEYWAGGGYEQLTQHTPLLITVFVRSSLDSPPRINAALLDPNRGLLMRYKPKILRALLAECDGTSSPMPQWDPHYLGESILRDAIQPVGCSAPRYAQDRGGVNFLALTLTFRCSFDWRLDG